MHSVQSIYDALRRMDADIERQIDELRADAKRIGADVYRLQDMNGAYVLSPLLVAKANCLGGIAALKAAELRNRKT